MRRPLLAPVVFAATLLLLSCAADVPGTDLPGTPEGPSSPRSEDRSPPLGARPERPPEPPPAPPLETVEISVDEIYPNAKQLASEVAQSLTTYDIGDGLDDVVAAVTSEVGAADALALVAGPLHHADSWSRGHIVYQQLCGVTADRACVMVVVEQQIGSIDGVRTETRTLDVRLLLEDAAWVFDELASAGGQPVPEPDDLPEVARAVLDDPRIDLPDTARWDILAGNISLRLLEVMRQTADEVSYGVVVLREGHPDEVFATDRISDHTRGRAVDIYRLDQTPVVDDRDDDSTTRALTDWLFNHPDVRQIGSPWDLDGSARRSFTDLTHQDHLHVSVIDDETTAAEDGT